MAERYAHIERWNLQENIGKAIDLTDRNAYSAYYGWIRAWIYVKFIKYQKN